MNPPDERFRRAFLLLLVFAISIAFLLIIRSFLVALLLAAIVTGLTKPWHDRLTTLFRGRIRLAAVTTLLLIVVVVAVPASAFLGIVVSQALSISAGARPWIEQQLAHPGFLDELLSRIPLSEDLLPSSEELLGKAAEFASTIGAFLADQAVGFSEGTARFFLLAFVMLYAVYFFLIDGDRILDRILYFIPLSNEAEQDLVGRFMSVSRAVLKGSVIIAILQGVMSGLAFLALGVPGWAFWTTVMIVLSVIPAVGGALVWIPAVIYLWLIGSTGSAIALALWCGLVVGTVDNFLRPRLVGKDTEMPDLLVLLGTIGGIYVFGMVGFILGPIVVALFLAVWDQYGVAFADSLPPTARQIAARNETPSPPAA